MWQKSFQNLAKNLTKIQIWGVLTDINHWKDWDKDIEWTKMDGEARLHADFILKPKGGPKTRLTIVQCDKPDVFADIAHLPLAKMQTLHRLTDTPEGVLIEVEVRVTGLLSFLWAKIIAEKQVQGGLAQTNQLIAKAMKI